MKYLLILILITIASSTVLAQNSLSGHITDQATGKSLPFTSLFINDLQKGGICDSIGNYAIKDLPAGDFLLQASFIGYRSWAGKVHIKGNTQFDIKLSPAAAEMSEVIITGTSAAVERRLNPVPSMILKIDDLRRSNSSNIIDALARRPGISQVTTGSGISKPVIRGLGYNRVVVLYDGVRQEDQQWGDEHGIEIDKNSVNRIEVIKGAGSIMYGSDAMAGVINFMDAYPPETGTVKLNINSEFQTNNNLASLSLENSGNINGINWLLRGSRIVAGNFSNPTDGKVFNSGFEETNANGYFGINRNWGYTQIQYSLFSQHVGLVDGNRDSLGKFTKPVIVGGTSVEEQPVTEKDLEGYQIAVPWQRLLHLKVVSSSSLVLGKTKLSFKAGFQQNRRGEIGDPLYPDKASLNMTLNTFTYDLKYELPHLSGWETSLGISGMLQSNLNSGVEYLIPDYTLQDAGIFVFSQKTIHKLNLSGGLRVDYRNFHSNDLVLPGGEQKFSGFTRDFSALAGSFGASYNFSDFLVLKANLSKGFRAPNVAELASNGRHEGTYRFELGNKNLAPENSYQADAGIDIDRTHISFETDIFVNKVNNYIFPEKLISHEGGDSIVNPADPAPAFLFVQGNALLYGGEITLDIHPHPFDWIHFENTLGYVRGIQPGVADSMRNLPMIPPLKLTSQLRFDIAKSPKWIKNLYISAGIEADMKQSYAYTAYGTETSSRAYSLVNAGIGFDITGKGQKTFANFSMSASNLLNVSYQDHLSRLRYAPVNPLTGNQGIYNMGRNIGFRLLVPLSWKVKA